MTTDEERRHLRRCVELAAQALEAGDEPFGSVLVAADGTVLAEDRNRVASAGDPTRHPEFELARWAAANLALAERAAATVYTSGEHCPMCAAAHGWVGLGRIVYVQLDVLQKKIHALASPDLADSLTNGDLESEWPALPFYARRRIVETLIARVTLLPVGRGCRQFHPSSLRIEWTFSSG